MVLRIGVRGLRLWDEQHAPLQKRVQIWLYHFKGVLQGCLQDIDESGGGTVGEVLMQRMRLGVLSSFVWVVEFGCQQDHP